MKGETDLFVYSLVLVGGGFVPSFRKVSCLFSIMIAETFGALLKAIGKEYPNTIVPLFKTYILQTLNTNREREKNK